MFFKTFFFLSQQLMGNMYKKSGNDYKMMPYKFGPLPLCDFIKNEKYIYPDLVKVSTLPPGDNCDWKIGTYTINDYYSDIKIFPSVLQSGDYMVTSIILKNGELMNGFKVMGSLNLITNG